MMTAVAKRRLELPPADYEDPMSVWAFFGLAVYAANLVEQSLVNLAAVLQIPAVNVVTQQELDEIFEELDRKTLGQLLFSAGKLIDIPEALGTNLYGVLDKRNYLVHSFFRIHAEDALSDVGRRIMIDELRDLIAFLKEVDPELECLYMPLWERYGINEAFVQAQWVAAQARAAARDAGAAPQTAE